MTSLESTTFKEDKPVVVKTINAKTLKKMFLAGAARIEAKKEYINELNVFPVPDGDTGTNMTLTIMSAVKELNAVSDSSMEEVAKAISSGSLRGARGNSGVILSQLFRGFTKEIKSYEDVNVTIMANAFQKASETAYRAVMKPKEGTILTVARGGAEKAAQLVSETEDLMYFCQEVIAYMDEVLEQTPELLPVLKEAGVVDSGGQGLIEIIKGCFDALIGKETLYGDITVENLERTDINVDKVALEDIKFGYCTEFIILLDKKFDIASELSLKDYFTSIGDSIVVVSDDDIVKVHVHTNDPGLAIQQALTYGSLTSIKIDNMREEHSEKVIKDAMKKAKQQEMESRKLEAPRKKYGFIAVSIGDGLDEIFKGLNVDYLIKGGQTMNPSTEDMLNAIREVNADNIFILPNNGNIVLAAEQAKALTEDKNIIVIPTKTIPQGITALINFIYEKTVKENTDKMIKEIDNVRSGQVTYAVRDTSIDGKDIKQGNIMGLDNKTILSVGTDIKETTIELIKALIDEDTQLVSLYFGEKITEEIAQELADELSSYYPNIDVDVQYGGQPIYYYILSVE